MQKSLTADLVIYCIFFIRLSFLIVCSIYYPNELTSWVFNKWWLAEIARSILCSGKIQSSVINLLWKTHIWMIDIYLTQGTNILWCKRDVKIDGILSIICFWMIQSEFWLNILYSVKNRVTVLLYYDSKIEMYLEKSLLPTY